MLLDLTDWIGPQILEAGGQTSLALWSGPAFGTCFSLKVPEPLLDPIRQDCRLEALEAEILQTLLSLNQFASPFDEASFVCAYAKAPKDSWHPIPEPFRPLMDLAFDVAKTTEGAFHPGLGHLVADWGFGPRTVTPGLPNIQGQRVWRPEQLYHDGRLFQPGGVEIDLCGIAKGYGVDLLAACFEAWGIPSYLIEIGGELRAKGLKADLQPWWVEINDPSPSFHPHRRLSLALGLEGESLAMATSGDQLRSFEHEGTLYSHTLDPRTRAPIRHSLSQVTVVAKDCATADALATALLVMGPDTGMAYATAHDLKVLFLDRTPRGLAERFSPALRAFLSD